MCILSFLWIIFFFADLKKKKKNLCYVFVLIALIIFLYLLHWLKTDTYVYLQGYTIPILQFLKSLLDKISYGFYNIFPSSVIVRKL